MPTPQFDVDVEDVEFVRHGSAPLLARLMLPRGAGPFPAVVSIHGGAWYLNDRTHRSATRQQLARHGIVVVSIDFRMPPHAVYPAALADINFAVRWVKANAARLRTSPHTVGIQGESSGGHLAVLAGIRPHDKRYSAIPNQSGVQAIDARVSWVIAFWPVISPLGRYRYAKLMASQGKLKRMTGLVLPGHEQFWDTEDAMSEGDPVLAFERGEQLDLPPTICIQNREDLSHPIAHLERFAELYRRAGGVIDLEELDLPATTNLGITIEEEPNGAVASEVMGRVSEFVGRYGAPKVGVAPKSE
jgi:acetyl esterase/lipase